MNADSLVSIIIPTHNRADLLFRSISSVLDQTYKNFEIIIVSDGYDEKTDKVAKRLLNTDKRISYYFYDSAKGGNFARNYGIDKSNGAYIAFLDDDDEWMPSKLERQLKAFEKNEKIGLVYTSFVSKCVFDKHSYYYSSICREEGDLSKKILLGNVIGTTSSVVVKKELLVNNKFDTDLPAMQDYDLWIRLCQTTLVAVISEPLITYYNDFTTKNKNKNSQISNSIEKYNKAAGIIKSKYLDLFESLSEEEKIEKKQTVENGRATRYIRIGDNSAARKSYKKILGMGVSKKYLIRYLMSMLPYECWVKFRSKDHSGIRGKI